MFQALTLRHPRPRATGRRRSSSSAVRMLPVVSILLKTSWSRRRRVRPCRRRGSPPRPLRFVIVLRVPAHLSEQLENALLLAPGDELLERLRDRVLLRLLGAHGERLPRELRVGSTPMDRGAAGCLRFCRAL